MFNLRLRSAFLVGITALMVLAVQEEANGRSTTHARFSGKWQDLVRFIDDNTRCQMEKNTECRNSNVERHLVTLGKMTPAQQLIAVNRWINSFPYIDDRVNWQAYDYWVAIETFMRKSGDCEDFALAKYIILRRLGYKAQDMRLVIVRDTRQQPIHALLLVRSGSYWLALDNQSWHIARFETLPHYKPLLSLNEQNWWLHDSLTIHFAKLRRELVRAHRSTGSKATRSEKLLGAYLPIGAASPIRSASGDQLAKDRPDFTVKIQATTLPLPHRHDMQYIRTQLDPNGEKGRPRPFAKAEIRVPGQAELRRLARVRSRNPNGQQKQALR